MQISLPVTSMVYSCRHLSCSTWMSKSGQHICGGPSGSVGPQEVSVSCNVVCGQTQWWWCSGMEAAIGVASPPGRGVTLPVPLPLRADTIPSVWVFVCVCVLSLILSWRWRHWIIELASAILSRSPSLCQPKQYHCLIILLSFLLLLLLFLFIPSFLFIG